jgi:hypothetical protein
MHSTDTNADLELLAALMDGRLSGAEGARAVKLLAESDDEVLEAFANAVRDQSVEDAKIVPIHLSRRRRQWKVIVPVAVAAALAIMMVPRLTGRHGNQPSAALYAIDITRDPRLADGLGAGWEEHGWPVTRGVPEAAGTPGANVDPKYAFRLGVQTVDLQVSLQRRDTALARAVANEMTTTLGNFQLADKLSTGYGELSRRLSTDSINQSTEHASSLENDLRDYLGSQPLFAFGQWTNAAALAARTRNTAFFESDRGIRYIQSAIPADVLTDDDTRALQSIVSLVNQGLDDRALGEVEAELKGIIRNRGS